MKKNTRSILFALLFGLLSAVNTCFAESITVRKIWNDNANRNGSRPKSICVTLTSADGTIYRHSITGSNKESVWEYTFTNVKSAKGYDIVMEDDISCTPINAEDPRPGMPNFGNPQNPGKPNQQNPGMPNPAMPNFGNPQNPGKPNQQNPGMPNPGKPNQQNPGMPKPGMPNPPKPQPTNTPVPPKKTSVNIPTMTSNTAPKGKVTCSKVWDNSPTWACWKAFDKKNNTWFGSLQGTSKNGYVQYDFGYLIEPYKITYNNTGDGDSSRQFWRVRASADGKKWDVLWQVKEPQRTVKTYTKNISTTKQYRYFRIDSGGNDLGMCFEAAEFNVYGYKYEKSK